MADHHPPSEDEDNKAADPAAHAAQSDASSSSDSPEHDGDMPSEDELPHLSDEIVTLIEDAVTFVHTEIAYRRAMVAFIFDRAKVTIIFGLGALIIAIMALIALVVGAVLGLTPLITAWGAGALVGMILLVIAGLMGRKAVRALMEALTSFQNDKAASDMLSPADRWGLGQLQTAVTESEKCDEQSQKAS